jgi:hypothetical protein
MPTVNNHQNFDFKICQPSKGLHTYFKNANRQNVIFKMPTIITSTSKMPTITMSTSEMPTIKMLN